MSDSARSLLHRCVRTAAKYALVCTLGIFVLGAGFMGYWILRIRSFDSHYGQVQVGDTESRLQDVLGEPDSVKQVANIPSYFERHTEFQNSRPKYELWYTLPTFYLPITWAYLVDENGRVVGKHRYD